MFEAWKAKLEYKAEKGKASSLLQIAVNRTPSTDEMRIIEEIVVNKQWRRMNMWSVIPEGVGVISFDNGIIARRNFPELEPDSKLARWTLDDVNAYCRTRFPDWKDIEIEHRK